MVLKMNRGFSAVGLVNPKTNFNTGGVVRAAYIYDSAFVAISGKRYSKHATDTMKGCRHMPVLHNLEDIFVAVPYDCVPIAVELHERASSIFEFQHPERAFYIFGQEDGTLGQEILDRCRSVIYIPTRQCMNLAATVNVVLFDRISKRKECLEPIKK